MPIDPRLYLDDILEAIERIREYLVDYEFDQFKLDRKTQDAVLRNLEVIGEAAGRLPETVKMSASEVEWRKIVGLRNILAHEYFGVSLPIIWDVAQNKLRHLEMACKSLIDDE